MIAENSQIKSLEFEGPVEGGRKFRVIFEAERTAAAKLRDSRRGFVVMLEVRDAEDEILPGPYDPFSYNERLGWWRYQEAPIQGSARYAIDFFAPEDARHVRITVRPQGTRGYEMELSDCRQFEGLSMETLHEFVETTDSQLTDQDLRLIELPLRKLARTGEATSIDRLRELAHLPWASPRLHDRIVGNYFHARMLLEPDCDLLGECEAFLMINDVPAAHIYKGAMHYAAGDRSAAYDCFLKARSAACPPVRYYAGVNSIRPYAELGDWYETDGIISEVSEIEWQSKKKPSSDLVLLFAGDSRFFLELAKHITDCLAKVNCPWLVHFHVINWDPDCARLARKIPATVSSEAAPDDITWYATSRFYRAAEFMEMFDADLIISDMDVDIVKAPQRPEEYCDVGLRPGPDRFPWWSPTGGCLYLSNTPGGRRFADALRLYIGARFYFDYPTSWWFDQLALNETLHAMKQRGEAPSTGIVPPYFRSRKGRQMNKLKQRRRKA